MASKKSIAPNVLSALLIGLLLFPSAVQFAHIFEGHDHKPCSEITTHLHEKQLDCTLFDFHFSNFSYSVAEYPEFYSLDEPSKLETRYCPVEVSANSATYFVRGPPANS
ncbi:hypothetical protein [Marixanthomonas spongiae]|uniref:Uncharacterized protein n=1 Tax=Marixanthomonas spongiae TaxID=2174845 RepID=A0A2U0HYM9_9FLAO|nr:hypothetical protein [Marixanthomonas spongiae]PVW13850.1 hypothetical protein DDV96_11895 [Marixanthomonas spongiae]